MVRAKFVVSTVTTTKEGGTVELRPVTNGSKENEAFYKWTPGGSITLSTINRDALDQFVPGQEMYVDFTPATGDKPKE